MMAPALRPRLARPLKSLLGPRWTVYARCLARGYELPRWGNLRRTRPFSENFGFERGTPVDRYYLENFLREHSHEIRGDVLEIQLPSYGTRFGTGVRRVDTLDVEPSFRPTYLCDLARCEGIVPSEAYDCFLLLNTLQHLREPLPALRNALRIVRPGGVILASSAGLLPLIPDGPEYWRLTPEGWTEVARLVWPGCEVEVRAHGNCLAASAAMLGLAWEELRREELDVHDPRFPVLVTVRCRKP